MKVLMKWVMVVSAVGLTIPGLSCRDDFVESSCSISGAITDSLTGEGIDSAGVAIDDESAISVYADSLGLFNYTNWGGGTRRVFAMKEGYESKSKLVNLSANPTDVDFQLVRE